MIDAAKSHIQKAAVQIEWDKVIEKKEVVNPQQYIIEVNNILNNMYKVLIGNLSLTPEKIEANVMLVAITEICKSLEGLYVDQTSKNTSKYAKKRIKVDLKSFLRNCDNAQGVDKQLKLTKVFKQMHFNLLIQEDEVKISQTIEENISSTTDSSQEIDLSKIIVEDPYSDIKKYLKNILINRCSVKMEELH